ncbi:TOG array regulator of axonemal microtubules protein 1-like isoform X2 [Astyanax mexicanus]|uniref:TOG array regulator of axonemal microtubules protein 1-like isoform X2 n=1 Tax=Astyanax mexicanus TaxID=7994 RepID=UPI0020CAACBD|nr:TOG array regulator of axonemal microtubules protein 1-like isoform X2 [Astyanax mexicanus]
MIEFDYSEDEVPFIIAHRVLENIRKKYMGCLEQLRASPIRLPPKRQSVPCDVQAPQAVVEQEAVEPPKPSKADIQAAREKEVNWPTLLFEEFCKIECDRMLNLLCDEKDDGSFRVTHSVRESIRKRHKEHLEQLCILANISTSTLEKKCVQQPGPSLKWLPLKKSAPCKVQAPKVVVKQEAVKFTVLHTPVCSRPFPTQPAEEEEKQSAYYTSPGSKIPCLDGQKQQRPVEAEVAACRKRDAEKQHKGGKPLELPALTSEEPLDKPKKKLSQAFSLLQDKDWEKEIEGLRLIRALAEHHSEVLLPELRIVCIAVTDEVKNLHLVVSRAAMVTLAHLFAHLQKNMDKELKVAASVLLHRSGEPSLFIKEAVELALSYMVQHCSPGQVLEALLAGGFSHKNSAVRTSTSLHLMKLVQVMGASCVLTGRKQFANRILPALTKQAFDPNQDVRLYCRNALQTLASHKDGVRMINKFVLPRDQLLIHKMLVI